MKLITSFTIYGEPKPLKRHRLAKAGFSYDPSKADKYEFLIKSMTHKPNKPYDFEIYVNMRFFFERKKGHYTSALRVKRRKNAPKYPKHCDIDNLIKFVFDALNKDFWMDDRQIVKTEASKAYTIGKGRTVIEIYKMEPLFDS